MNELESESTEASPGDLRAELARRGISLEEEQIERLGSYARQLWDWNTRLNLTRHTDFARFVGRDLVDSQAVAELLETGERVLDVGTGGGVPGALIAILRPDVEVALCDSIGKKAKAVSEIVAAAGIETPVHGRRVQDLLEEQEFDTLVIRAVGPLGKVLGWLEPHWGRFGRALFIKGPKWVDERHEAREQGKLRGLMLRKVASYPLEGTESESVILEVRPRDDAARES